MLDPEHRVATCNNPFYGLQAVEGVATGFQILRTLMFRVQH